MMHHARRTLLFAIAVLSAACATTYTWTGGDPALLQVNHQDCTKKAHDQAPYIPLITYAFGGWNIRPTLYKDCMEKRGYTKVNEQTKLQEPPEQVPQDPGQVPK